MVLLLRVTSSSAVKVEVEKQLALILKIDKA
jgi:hypothetical protein